MEDSNIEVSEVTAKPLVSWKNAPTLANLKQDYMDAKPSHDAHKTSINTWLDNLHVRNAALVDVPKGNSKIVPKLIRKQAEWRYPALSDPFLSSEDVFNVRPVTWEDRDAAKQNELVLNNQFNTKMDKVRFIDDYVRTAVDEGTVIVRMGWDFEEEEYEEEVPDVQFRVNPQLMEQHQQLEQMKQESPSQYEAEVPEEMKQAHDLSMQQGVPIEPIVTGYHKEKKIRTVVNKPTAMVCDYRNVILDPSCAGDMKKAKFVIFSFETSLAELKKDGKYKNLDNINVEGNSILGTPDHAVPGDTQNFNFNDKPRKKFVAYEYWGFWDINGDNVLKPIVATWVGSTLIRMEENPFPDKALPFVVVPYLPVRRSLYGEPDGSLLEDNQKIIGAVTRGMIDIMGKSANGQTGMRKDMLDATNRRKFEKGQDYEFNQNVDPRQGIHMHTYPEIPQSAQFMLQMQNMEAESLTGVKSFSQGVSGQSLGDVAAGVRGALDAASKRELGILRRLSAGICEIGRKIISMNSEFLSEEEVVRITNDKFVKVRRDDLAGSFDLRLSISTAEEDNNKAQELAFMLQTVGPNEDPEIRKMVLADICRLRKMPDLAHKIEAYQPQPDPMQQQMQMLQMQLLQAQIAKENAQAELAHAQAQLSGAKIGTEEVKQGHIQSDTDLKNLNFVEQESGVHQEREIQKINTQAAHTLEHKALDAHMQERSNQYDLEKEKVKANNSKKE